MKDQKKLHWATRKQRVFQIHYEVVNYFPHLFTAGFITFLKLYWNVMFCEKLYTWITLICYKYINLQLMAKAIKASWWWSKEQKSLFSSKEHLSQLEETQSPTHRWDLTQNDNYFWLKHNMTTLMTKKLHFWFVTASLSNLHHNPVSFPHEI